MQQQSEHEPDFIAIKDVMDLPDYILSLVQSVGDTEPDLFYQHKATYDFEQLIDEYMKLKLSEAETGLSKLINEANMKGKKQRLKDFCIKTLGMTDATKIHEWLLSYPKVVTAKSRQNLLQDVKFFIKYFLRIKVGGHSSKIEFEIFCDAIDRLYAREKKLNRVRQHIVKKAAGNVLPKPTELNQLRNKVMLYLNEKLKSTSNPVNKTEYYQTCCCLVALIIFRNSSRSGTVTCFRMDYWHSLRWNDSLKLYTVELAPEEIINVKGGAGERHRMAALEKVMIVMMDYWHSLRWNDSLKLYTVELAPEEIIKVKGGAGERNRMAALEKVMIESHKNFQYRGTQIQVFSAEERELMLKFVDLREQMAVKSDFLRKTRESRYKLFSAEIFFEALVSMCPPYVRYEDCLLDSNGAP